MSHYVLFPLIPVGIAVFASLASAEISPTPSPAADPKTGLEGVITISPTHGGPIRQGEPSSAPLSKRAFVVRQEDRAVAEFETDEQGRFRIVLAPGRYTVAGKDPKHRFDRFGPMTVDVVAGKMTQVTWDFDTGLR